MGLRGPQKTPSALTKLRGNPGKRSANKSEVKPKDAKDLQPPAWLRPEAKQEWFVILPALRALGLYTEVDRAALANYCIAWADLQIAEQHLQEDGDMYWAETKSGSIQMQSPWQHVKNRAQVQCNRWAREFGFTPASRASLVSGDKVETDEFSAWANGKGK